MSLYILGSTSRITSSLVLQLSKNKQYKNITISDFLPTYSFHNRFYRLQKQLQNAQYQTKLTLTRPNTHNDINKQAQFDDVLFITHDYYQNVVSKTKAMELLANSCKSRSNLYFVTPVEYDHFGFTNPESNYQIGQNYVRDINRNSTIIRSDVQDKGQALAYFNAPKQGFLDKAVFDSKFHFEPRIVNLNNFVEIVADVIAKKVQGKRIIVRGKQSKKPLYANIDGSIEASEYKHGTDNVIGLAQKYNGLLFKDYQQIISH